jgi:MOSC domain-containing protein YiiM
MISLRERLLIVPQIGQVTWIGVRPEHGAELTELSEVVAIAGRGLAGDIAARGKLGGNRQVSLVQEEHLAVLAGLTGAHEVRPQQLRRNLAIAGINLIALSKLRFAIGEEVVLVGSGACSPCQLMDETLGPGGFQAARGHGGITARVERGGTLRVGDSVRVLPAETEAPDSEQSAAELRADR